MTRRWTDPMRPNRKVKRGSNNKKRIDGSYGDGVLHVRHGRGELVEVELGAVWNGEGQVAGNEAGREEGVLPEGPIRQDGRMELARGYALASCQGRHVQDNVRLEVFVGVNDPVRQDETAFRVRVVDLHRPAGVERVDVVRTGGERADGILSQADHGVEVLLETGQDGDPESGQNGRSPAAVPLHAGHGRLPLDGQAASVVDDALAHPGDGLGRSLKA